MKIRTPAPGWDLELRGSTDLGLGSETLRVRDGRAVYRSRWRLRWGASAVREEIEFGHEDVRSLTLKLEVIAGGPAHEQHASSERWSVRLELPERALEIAGGSREGPVREAGIALARALGVDLIDASGDARERVQDGALVERGALEDVRWPARPAGVEVDVAVSVEPPRIEIRGPRLRARVLGAVTLMIGTGWVLSALGPWLAWAGVAPTTQTIGAPLLAVFTGFALLGVPLLHLGLVMCTGVRARVTVEPGWLTVRREFVGSWSVAWLPPLRRKLGVRRRAALDTVGSVRATTSARTHRVDIRLNRAPNGVRGGGTIKLQTDRTDRELTVHLAAVVRTAVRAMGAG